MSEIDDPNQIAQAIANDTAASSHRDGFIPTDGSEVEYAQLHQFMESFPPAQAIGQLRSQYLDEMLRQQIAAGCKQVVILGSEFEFYADRLTSPDVRFFEVSQAAFKQRKLAQLTENGSTLNTTYIAENYLQSHLVERLQQYQFDIHLPTYFVWADGVSSLKRGDIVALIDTLRSQVRQFHLSFSYLSHQILDRSTHDPTLNQTLDCLEHLGIRWITVFKDIAPFTRALGLNLLETHTIAQLHDRYNPQSSLPSTLLYFYYVCTIAKQEQNW